MNEIEQFVELQKIQQLLGRYTLTIDAGDSEGWANCFTEDGQFVSGPLALVGREKLKQYVQVHHAAFGSRHITSSPVYDLSEDGKTATGTASTVVIAATRSGYKPCYAGWYEDELVRDKDGWRIARRAGFVTGVADDPTYPVLTCDPELAELVKPLLKAFQELSEPV